MQKQLGGRRELVLWLAGGLLILAGLWITFRYAFAVWGLDADTAVPIAMWRGVKAHGLPFLATWTYTSDNWLLSLLPVSALVYEIFGVGADTQPAIGWMIFVASVAMTAWLAGKIGGRLTGLAVACVLIFANYDALGPAGFMAYPVTHNISMAWALLSLVTAVRTLDRREVWAAALLVACVFIDVLSDPWAAPAVALPLILASGAVAALRRKQPEGRGALLVLAAAVVGTVLGMTHLFGVLSFLPRSHFEPNSLAAMASNAYWVLIAVAHIFNVTPGGDPETRGVKIVNVGLFLTLFSLAALICLARFRRLTPRQQLVTGTAITSVAGVTAAFIIGKWELALNVGRFFPNLGFFGALAVAGGLVALGSRWRWRAAAPVAIYAVMLIISAAVCRPDLLRHSHRGGTVPKARDLGAFLQANGLTYGYGPYWGAMTLVMDTATDGRVTIRPVTFRGGSVARRPAETSAFWFSPSDEPPGLADRFLLIRNDGEECPDPQACEEMAERQFGAPARRLRYEDATILVWTQPLAERIGK